MDILKLSSDNFADLFLTDTTIDKRAYNFYSYYYNKDRFKLILKNTFDYGDGQTTNEFTFRVSLYGLIKNGFNITNKEFKLLFDVLESTKDQKVFYFNNKNLKMDIKEYRNIEWNKIEVKSKNVDKNIISFNVSKSGTLLISFGLSIGPLVRDNKYVGIRLDENTHKLELCLSKNNVNTDISRIYAFNEIKANKISINANFRKVNDMLDDLFDDIDRTKGSIFYGKIRKIQKNIYVVDKLYRDLKDSINDVPTKEYTIPSNVKNIEIDKTLVEEIKSSPKDSRINTKKIISKEFTSMYGYFLNGALTIYNNDILKKKDYKVLDIYYNEDKTKLRFNFIKEDNGKSRVLSITSESIKITINSVLNVIKSKETIKDNTRYEFFFDEENDVLYFDTTQERQMDYNNHKWFIVYNTTFNSKSSVLSLSVYRKREAFCGSLNVISCKDKLSKYIYFYKHNVLNKIVFSFTPIKDQNPLFVGSVPKSNRVNLFGDTYIKFLNMLGINTSMDSTYENLFGIKHFINYSSYKDFYVIDYVDVDYSSRDSVGIDFSNKDKRDISVVDKDIKIYEIPVENKPIEISEIKSNKVDNISSNSLVIPNDKKYMSISFGTVMNKNSKTYMIIKFEFHNEYKYDCFENTIESFNKVIKIANMLGLNYNGPFTFLKDINDSDTLYININSDYFLENIHWNILKNID